MFEAEAHDPERARVLLEHIAGLYEIEDRMRQQALVGEARRLVRVAESKPHVQTLCARRGDICRDRAAPSHAERRDPALPRRHHPTESSGIVGKQLSDVFEFYQSGGGGYGDPRWRAVKLVQQDVRERVASVEKAASECGVTIDTRTFDVARAPTRERRGA